MSNLRHAQILSQMVNTPLMVHPRKAGLFYNFLSERAGTVSIELPDTPDASMIDALKADKRLTGTRPVHDASRFSAPWARTEDGQGIEPFRLTREGVGIITLTGSLVNRGAWIGSYSGQTSYEGIKFQLGRAANDRRVKSLLLDIESPGGQAVGAFEVGQMVRAVADVKPVTAVVNGMAASAAYSIASGASRIITTPSGITGSIGVVMLHLDMSEKLKADGVKPTLIFAGKHKMDGNGLEPLSEEVHADLLAECFQLYDMFIDTVAAGRRGKTSAKAARDTEGRTYIGKSAVEAKLADDVGTFEEVLADMSKKAKRRAVSPANSNQRSASTMSIRTFKAGDVDENTECVAAADHTNAVASARTEGETAGASAALSRVTEIMGNADCAANLPFALELAVESPGMSVDKIASLTKKAGGPVVEPNAQDDKPLTIEQRARATGADDVSSDPGTDQQQGKAAADQSGWGAHVAKVNARTADQRRARR